MRVITGLARGRKLKTVRGNDVRPTADRVKEGLFSAIQFDIEGRRVLDLFAGSGQLGIEALSRGAQSAVFVDSSDASLEAVKENLRAVGLQSSATVLKADFSDFLKTTRLTFDIAFLDPPYAKGLLPEAMSLLTRSMSEAGVIICEHPTEMSLPEEVGKFKLSRSYKYGKVMLSFYRRG